MPLRIQVYAAFFGERYGLPVFPVVINVLPPARGVVIPDRHDRTFMGLRTLREYGGLNLWEIDARHVLQAPIKSLLPFVPVLRGVDNEDLIRRALAALPADQQLSEIEPLFAFFATFILDVKRVLEIIRWDMVVLRQSLWYTEILEEGRQEGRQEGLHAASALLVREILATLARRFGATPPDVKQTLSRHQSVMRAQS